MQVSLAHLFYQLMRKVKNTVKLKTKLELGRLLNSTSIVQRIISPINFILD